MRNGGNYAEIHQKMITVGAMMMGNLLTGTGSDSEERSRLEYQSLVTNDFESEWPGDSEKDSS